MNVQSLISLTKGQDNPFLKLSSKTPPILLKTDETDGTATTTNDTDNSTNQPEAPAPESSATREFNTFITLLTTQIRNQDPLAPLDSTQFVEQLATFSGLELQATANSTLQSIALMMADSLYPEATRGETSETDSGESSDSEDGSNSEETEGTEETEAA